MVVVPGRKMDSKEMTMRQSYVLVSLPDELRAEVEGRFLRAVAPLGPLLAQRLRRGRWRLWTILPEGAYEAGMSLDLIRSNLLHGGGWQARPEDPKILLSQWIESFLRRKPGRTVIFENDPARKGDPFLQTRNDAKIVYLKDRVYFYARSGASADEIETVIRYANSACWVMGMVVDSSSLDLSGEITKVDLREFASKAVSLICDAFGGESYVIAEMADGLSILPDRPQ